MKLRNGAFTPLLGLALVASTACGTGSETPSGQTPPVSAKEPGTTGSEPSGGGYESPGGSGYQPPGSGGYEPPGSGGPGGTLGSGSGGVAIEGGVSGSSSGGITIGSSSGSSNGNCLACKGTYTCTVTPSPTNGSVTVATVKQADGSCVVVNFGVTLECDNTVLGATDSGAVTVGAWAPSGNGGFIASSSDYVFSCK